MELYIGDDSISKENLQSFKKQEEASTTSLDITDTSISMMNAADGKKRMHRVTVCVSNDCNLRCKYCYAKGGNYGRNRSVMSKKNC